jgi:plastocyanin
MLKSLAITAALLTGLATATIAQAATVAVAITNYTFTPGKITVHPGDKVTWTNQDSIPHTATALDGKTFDSGAIDPNASWSFTFPTAGIYKYRCSIHPDMQGEVDVQ